MLYASQMKRVVHLASYHIKLIALEGEHLLPLASRIARTQVSLLRLRINVSLGKTLGK